MSLTENGSVKATGEFFAYKLYAPTRHAGAIRREQIISRALVDDRSRVVLLQGPAGHGKSTALQQIKSECEERGSLTPHSCRPR